MSRFALSALIAASLMGLSADADQEPGFYIAGFIGASFPSDAELRGTQNPVAGAPGTAGAPARINADFDSDTTLGVALGSKTPWKFSGLFNASIDDDFDGTSLTIGAHYKF